MNTTAGSVTVYGTLIHGRRIDFRIEEDKARSKCLHALGERRKTETTPLGEDRKIC